MTGAATAILTATGRCRRMLAFTYQPGGIMPDSTKSQSSTAVADEQVVDAVPAGYGQGLVAYDTAMWPNLLDQDPAEVRERFAARFKAADTLDDLFDALSGTTAKGLVGRSVTIREITWAPYESDRGIVPNAICTGVEAVGGKPVEFATTGDMLVMFLRRAELTGQLPLTVRIVEKTTRSGNKALNFERP